MRREAIVGRETFWPGTCGTLLIMQTINAILVPSDFSEQSRQALHQARVIAHQAKLLWLHVLPPINTMVATVSQNVAEQEQALQRLKEAAGTGTNISCEVRFGNAAAEIVKTAADWNADLIVMPARSHGAIEHLLLGSVTERVLQLAECPVLVLPSQGS